jgi:prepilin-type N-terminal cleavage/methylation domain-containing protein
MMKMAKNLKKRGFTLIELLVVIAIIGILGGVSFGGYQHFIEQARKKNATDVCAQIKTAWTNFHREIGFWPEEYGIGNNGVKQMDTDMCLVLGKAKLLDVLYLDDDAENRGLKKNKDNEAELKFGEEVQ